MWLELEDAYKFLRTYLKRECTVSLGQAPVLCSDGFYYDRECIEDWLSAHSRSPMTNLQMQDYVIKSLLGDCCKDDLCQCNAIEFLHVWCRRRESSTRRAQNSVNTGTLMHSTWAHPGDADSLPTANVHAHVLEAAPSVRQSATFTILMRINCQSYR